MNYIWNGSVSTDWGNSSNWTPNGVPGSVDYVTIENATYLPVFDGASGVVNLTMSSGMLDLNGNTLSVSGIAMFTGGIINNGTIDLYCSEATFGGTAFSANVTAVCADVALNGSTFTGCILLSIEADRL